MDTTSSVPTAPRRLPGRPGRTRLPDLATAAKVAAMLTSTDLTALAATCEVSQGTMSHWLSGVTTPPPEKAEQLVRAIFARWVDPDRPLT